MKKSTAVTTYLTCMVAAALALGFAFPAAAHTPVPGPNFQGCVDLANLPYTPRPPRWAYNNNVEVELQNPILWPEVYNFCAYADSVYCTLGAVGGLLGDDVLQFAFLVQCLTMDINGPLDVDAEIPVSPNGMLDAQYELGILQYLLNNPVEELHEAATDAFQYNFMAIRELVVLALEESGYRGLVNLAGAYHLVGTLGSLLAGFATLGDPETNAALEELLGLLEDLGLDAPDDISEITMGILALGPHGDLDGDGYTNIQEYMYFVNELGYTPEAFIAAVMDPNQRPPIIEPYIRLSAKTGFLRVGDTANLQVTTRNFLEPPISISWYKDGDLLDGETQATLIIPNLTAEDEGLYQVAVETIVVVENKDGKDGGLETEVVTLNAYFVLTLIDGVLPIGGVFGLAALAAACAVAGALRTRRR